MLWVPHFVRNDKLTSYLRRNVLACLLMKEMGFPIGSGFVESTYKG